MKDYLNRNRKKILIMLFILICSLMSYAVITSSVCMYPSDLNVDCFIALIKTIFVIFNLSVFAYLSMK